MKTFAARIGQRLASRVTLSASATINEFQDLGGCARIIATIQGAPNLEEVTASIVEAIGSKVTCIAGSFREIDTAGDKLHLIGYVASHAPMVPMTKAVTARMTVIAKNVLMDPADESTWDIKEVGGQKFLCRQENEDLSQLLTLARHRDTAAHTFDEMLDGVPRAREYVTYVDTDAAETRHGYCISSTEDTVQVLCRQSGQVANVDLRAVVEIHNMGDSDAHIHAAVETAGRKFAQASEMADGGNLTDMREYYREVFSYDPEYYAKFEEIITAHGF
jgi:hypothetical protein